MSVNSIQLIYGILLDKNTCSREDYEDDIIKIFTYNCHKSNNIIVGILVQTLSLSDINSIPRHINNISYENESIMDKFCSRFNLYGPQLYIRLNKCLCC